MFSFAKLLTLASITSMGYAAVVHNPTIHHCSDAKLVKNTTLEVDGVRFEYTSHSCALRSVTDQQPQTTSSINICGGLCNTGCDNADGVLPPISEDCQTIKNAIQILQDRLSPSIAEPGHIEALTFGTCTYSFQNNSYDILEYCWPDVSIQASEAGSACFPPVQPFYSHGYCSAFDDSWSVSAAHS